MNTCGKKIRILENNHLVNDIAFNKVDKFLISEELADYLLNS
jgi:hypothetical protein